MSAGDKLDRLERALSSVQAHLQPAQAPEKLAEGTGTGAGQKVKRKTKNEKIALITDALTNSPKATSAEIGRATGIDESGVRKLWGVVKMSMKSGKTRRGLADLLASCSICRAPVSGPFECEICKEIISGECKTCHYTNEHPEDAIP